MKCVDFYVSQLNVDWAVFEFMKKMGTNISGRTRSKTCSNELLRKAFGKGPEILVWSGVRKTFGRAKSSEPCLE
jgi:hypothetical protein